MTIQEYKCPNCNGAITFDSFSQNMKCPYCESEFDLATLKEYDEILKEEHDLNKEMTWDTRPGTSWQEDETKGLAVYACKSCSGEIVGDEHMAATSCPYCGNVIVLMHQFYDELRPDYVIPFKLDKEAAKAGLQKHLEGKILLPKLFKDENYIEEIKGLYVPFWLFDSDVDATIRFKARKVRTWSDSKNNYTETRHFAIVRSGEVRFEKVAIDGSTKMADDLMESINPYDFDDAVDFQTAYLAGYLADKYDVTVEQSINRANERIKKSTEELFKSSVTGYQTVVTENSVMALTNSVSKYALYPVWVLTTSYAGKSYMFAMNGQTGKFIGNLPLDKKAALLWLVGLMLPFSVLAYMFILYALGA